MAIDKPKTNFSPQQQRIIFDTIFFLFFFWPDKNVEKFRTYFIFLKIFFLESVPLLRKNKGINLLLKKYKSH